MGFMSGITSKISAAFDNMAAPAEEIVQVTQSAAPEPQTVVQPVQEDDTSNATTSLVPAVQADNTPAVVGDYNSGNLTSGRFVPQGSQSQSSLSLITDAQRQTEHFRAVVETFDEDKQEPAEWVVRKMVGLFCYIAPFLLAIFIGMAVGDMFTPLNAGGWENTGIHMLSVFVEFVAPVLGLATTITFKRALKDRSAIGLFLGVAVFFLVVSIGNAIALMAVLAPPDGAKGAIVVASMLRSFGALVIDVGASIYLSISGAKSLKKYLADQQKKVEAVESVNAINIKLDQTQLKAGLDRVQAISEMQARQDRMATFNEAERLTQQAVLSSMKKKLGDSDDNNGGGGRSRYGNRW